MKKVLSYILCFCLILTLFSGVELFSVSAATYSGSCGTNVTWTYNTSTATLTISGNGAMCGYSSEYYNDTPLTTAPWRRFYQSMKTVIIDNGITSIDYCAFYGCSGLRSVAIPDSVTSISAYAFTDCSGLTSVVIPDSVTLIDCDVYRGCAGLETINVESGNKVYHSAGNCLIKTKAKTLIVGCKNSIIPTDGTVTSIGESAFDGCSGLTSVAIPDSVTSIGDRAFYGCSGLRSVAIPDSVTSIGALAFSATAWYYNQPDGLVYAGKVAYKYKGACPESVIIKDGTLGIAGDAFRGCTGLTTVTIPDSVTSIGKNAFDGCSGLTSITIPDSVTSIGNCAFDGCSGLTSVTISNSVTSIGSLSFLGCSGLTSVTIPDSVTSIRNEAFEGCSGLTSVTIGNSVTSIDYRAFYGCSGLTSVTIGNSVTSIGFYAFEGCYGLTSVHYQGTAQEWSNISIYSENSYLTNACRTYCTFNEWHIRTAPTCTETGTEYGTCTICGKEKTKTAEAALGHSFTNYISNNDATCTADGTKTAKCDRCDATDTVTDVGSNFGHNYNALVTPPTCTTQGYTTHTCSRCNDSYVADYVYMPCGEDCGFIIEGNTLYIHGSGDTDNYKTQASVPWYEYANQITEIQIDEEITKVGNYAFYCLKNLKSIKSKNNDLSFGKYAIKDSNTDITVFTENGGNAETYCTENGINYIDPTITPELETVTANSITVKAVSGYEYSKDGETWKKSNKFTGLSPASEYTIYARYADTADMFDTVGAPFICTTLKHTVAAPAAPDYQNHTESSITLVTNDLYAYSKDGENWQKSSEFTGLSKNTIYRFYQRIAETETEYASEPSAPLIIAIPDKPQIVKTTLENITIKYVEGFEYCLDDMVWQDSNSFDKLIDNTEYLVYQRLKAVEGEKVYGITSEYTAVTTDNSVAHTHTLGEWLYNEQNHWRICADCGEKFDEAAHTPGDWITDIEPTTETAGHKHTECTVCGYVLAEEDIPQLPAYIPGDINGDDAVNNKDLTRLFQYLSDWDVEVSEAALDINGDGSVNNKDLTRLFQYLSDWDVEIY